MLRRGFFVAGTVAGIVATHAARAETIVTFSDPAAGPGTPVFSYSNNTLTGGWELPGLTLQTPGLFNVSYSNATFTMTSLTTMSDLGPVQIMSGGEISFFDALHNPLLTLDFSSATLSGPLSLGSSDFVGNNVTFSGPLLNGATVTNEAFAFAFANPVGTTSSFTVTSSFTSSGDATLPGPSSASLLVAGGLMLTRRRNR